MAQPALPDQVAFFTVRQNRSTPTLPCQIRYAQRTLNAASLELSEKEVRRTARRTLPNFAASSQKSANALVQPIALRLSNMRIDVDGANLGFATAKACFVKQRALAWRRFDFDNFGIKRIFFGIIRRREYVSRHRGIIAALSAAPHSLTLEIRTALVFSFGFSKKTETA
jgi:hypothetical protein